MTRSGGERGTELALHGYWRSSSTWRVRIGLHLKALAFEHRTVDLRSGVQWSPNHGVRSPLHQVPVLEVREGGQVRYLVQSMAILAWLDERFPSPALLPADLWGRARVRALAEHVNSGIQPYQNQAPLKWLKARGGLQDEWVRHWLGKGLEGLERAVRDGAGRFCHGDEVTLADIYLVPQLYGARRYGVDVSNFPTLLRVEAACATLEPFLRSLPGVQPDAPPEERS